MIVCSIFLKIIKNNIKYGTENIFVSAVLGGLDKIVLKGKSFEKFFVFNSFFVKTPSTFQYILTI